DRRNNTPMIVSSLVIWTESLSVMKCASRFSSQTTRTSEPSLRVRLIRANALAEHRVRRVALSHADVRRRRGFAALPLAPQCARRLRHETHSLSLRPWTFQEEKEG